MTLSPFYAKLDALSASEHAVWSDLAHGRATTTKPTPAVLAFLLDHSDTAVVYVKARGEYVAYSPGAARNVTRDWPDEFSSVPA